MSSALVNAYRRRARKDGKNFTMLSVYNDLLRQAKPISAARWMKNPGSGDLKGVDSKVSGKRREEVLKARKRVIAVRKKRGLGGPGAPAAAGPTHPLVPPIIPPIPNFPNKKPPKPLPKRPRKTPFAATEGYWEGRIFHPPAVPQDYYSTERVQQRQQRNAAMRERLAKDFKPDVGSSATSSASAMDWSGYSFNGDNLDPMAESSPLAGLAAGIVPPAPHIPPPVSSVPPPTVPSAGLPTAEELLAESEESSRSYMSEDTVHPPARSYTKGFFEGLNRDLSDPFYYTGAGGQREARAYYKPAPKEPPPQPRKLSKEEQQEAEEFWGKHAEEMKEQRPNSSLSESVKSTVSWISDLAVSHDADVVPVQLPIHDVIKPKKGPENAKFVKAQDPFRDLMEEGDDARSRSASPQGRKTPTTVSETAYESSHSSSKGGYRTPTTVSETAYESSGSHSKVGYRPRRRPSASSGRSSRSVTESESSRGRRTSWSTTASSSTASETSSSSGGKRARSKSTNRAPPAKKRRTSAGPRRVSAPPLRGRKRANVEQYPYRQFARKQGRVFAWKRGKRGALLPSSGSSEGPIY